MNFFYSCNYYDKRIKRPFIVSIQKNINYKGITRNQLKKYTNNNICTYGLNKKTEDSKNYYMDKVTTNLEKTSFTERKKYNFQKRLYTSYSKFTEVKLVTIGIASPLRILQWAEKTLPNGKIYGEVLNANTLHHKTFKPQKGGLFCERIFGPLKDFECSCGKIDKTAKYSLRETEKQNKNTKENEYEEKIQDNIESKKSLGELTFGVTKDKKKTTRKLRKFCPDCDVEYTWSVIRRYQLGYIKLISPVTHVWFLKGTPSYLSILLDIKKRYLQSITYCSETLTIEHSESAASALQTYKISGFDLDSPSKIYASWFKAKNMGTISNQMSETNLTHSNSNRLTSYNNDPIYNDPIYNDPIYNDPIYNDTIYNDTSIDLTSTKKDIYLNSRIKRINIINKWEKNVKQSSKTDESYNYYSINKNRNLSVNKTSQLLTFLQKPIKENFFIKKFSKEEKNVKELNLYDNILKDLGILNKDKDIRFYILQLIYTLQLGIIYNDLVENLFSNNSFNLETFLIQKRLYEKQGLILNEDTETNFRYNSDSLFDSISNKNTIENSLKKELNISNNYYQSKIDTIGFSKIINKINKKSPIDLYIKATLQRMLYKKIIINSIVKTWQNIYKKAYVKAMYKTISYFLKTDQKKIFLEKNFISWNSKNTLFKTKNNSNNYEPENLNLNNFDIFLHYYRINKIYANKTSLKHLKNIILLVKSYFKKNILLTLQNIKQPIFNLHLQNTKNYTIQTDSILLNKQVYRLKPSWNPEIRFNFTHIPIPYSIPQLINKKSDEMTNFLSFDISSLVDLLAINGFMTPLIVGKLYQKTRSSTSLKSETYIAINENIETEHNNKQIDIKLSYKRQLFKIAKNLLKENNINFKNQKIFFNKRNFDLLESFTIKNNNIPYFLLNENISKLFSSKLLNQTSLDLYYLNLGKYAIKDKIKDNKLYPSPKNLPFTFISEKDKFINKNSKENFFIKKFSKENFFIKKFSNVGYKQGNKSNEFKNTSKSDIVNRNINSPLEMSKKKRLFNNVYTLSHRERWGSRVNEGKDWQIFLLYNTAVSNSKDQPIFAYKDRISSTTFNSQVYSSYKNSIVSQTQATSFLQNKEPYGVLINNSFFSGPGIIQQLLSELTLSEMKKLDKQNRLLLYILNKSIFKLKKHIKIFIYDRTSQTEMKELCKKRDLLIRRTKLVRKLFRKDSDPSSMIITVLPVLPPDLRPIVKMGGQIAASDLNRFYQRIIYRNDRLKKFLKDPATSHSYEMKYAQRLLQEAVDNLIQNSQNSGEKDSRGRALKSLSDILKGKQGRFRQFLLGKRVDYSGRSVIVVGPKLKLYECGIPLEMALELYLPFLLKIILNKNYAKTVVGAKALIKNNRPLALELLREIMQVSPVLLNRAPTLHRLGFQAFVPKLVEGRAILLHPLVCSSFNADFDGDQMAVHVPITIEARAEAWKLMLSRNNLLSPATGDPLSIPSQDMVLGCYYLTTNSNKATLSLLRGSGLFFTDLQKVLYAYDLQQIDLHALVWVKWSGLIENGNDQEEPLEIRVSTTGHWQDLSYNYIRHFDSSSQLLHQYMSTTPGRILFYSLIQSI